MLPKTKSALVAWTRYWLDYYPWWRHQMETFSALLALCAGNSPVPVNSPHKGQWRGALMFSVDLRLNKRLSKQPWGWWFETPSWSLWRQCNVLMSYHTVSSHCYWRLGSGRNFLLALQWRHNERDGVSNHRGLDCLLNRLFRPRSKKTSNSCHWLLWGESTGDYWIPHKGPVTRKKSFHLMTSLWNE